MTNTAAPNTVHTFELAGLGKAPFKFSHFAQLKYDRAQTAYHSGGSCDYCGTAIMNAYYIKSADGRTFKVGSDCVAKTGDAGLRKVVNKAKAQHERSLKAARALTTAEQITAWLSDDAVVSILESYPHPRGFAGKNLAHYCGWMLDNAGDSGRATVAAMIRRTIKQGARTVETAAMVAEQAREDRCDSVASARFESMAHGYGY